MCGICGQLNFARDAAVDRETVARMTASIRHRGPDDEGSFFDGRVGLGFRRLSIIDLAGGHQPMSDEARTVWVVFNGEIYNFPELRAELEGLGHSFRTRSDTEVIVEGYREWGTGVLDRLNGMFGLALWDARRKRLVVARDAMGIKPVYYRIEGGQLTFGSEIRAVVAADGSAQEIDPAALELLLRFRYTPSPLTIFRGVRKLAPGEMLVAEDGECRVQRWYGFTPAPFETPPSDDEATAQLLELYRAAVKRHLLSDVPVGVLLSGGVDSALLLALMNGHDQGWPAYTVGYGGTYQNDEIELARQSAELLRARHVPVLLDRSEFEHQLPTIVAALEEPITSSSIVPMYFVCARARQDVKVALMGQGPDELFGGYPRHLGVHYGRAWRRLPAPLRGVVTSAVGLLPRNEAAKRGVYALGTGDRLARYEHVFSLAPTERIAGLFRDGALNGHDTGAVAYWRDVEAQMQHTDELGGFQLLELRSSLPDELLMYADKLSMAHGLELRVPYLDRTIVEYAQRLAAGKKIRRGAGKWIHRQVCGLLLDPRILERRKRGFAVGIVDGWFSASGRDSLTDLLLDSSSLMYSVMRAERVRALLDEHRSGREDNHKLLFSLVMVEEWLRSAAGTHPLPHQAGTLSARPA